MVNVRTINKLIIQLSLVFILLIIGTYDTEALYCKYITNGTSYPSGNCTLDQKEISRAEFCDKQTKKPNVIPQVIKTHCGDGALLESTQNLLKESTNIDVCEAAVYRDGTITSHESILNEVSTRELSLESCKAMTGRYTTEEQAIIKEELRIAKKNAMIDQYKNDCQNIGFTPDTEAMGNCILKLMELNSVNVTNTTNTFVTESTSNSEAIEIEKQKLEELRRQTKAAEAAAAEAKKSNKREGLKEAERTMKKGLCIATRADYWNC